MFLCLGEIFTRGALKRLDSIFWLANAFSSNLNTLNLNIFPNICGIYRLQRKFKKNSIDRQSPKGSIKISEDILEVNHKGLGCLVINIINLFKFYWFWLGSKIFFKRESELNKRCFKIVDWSTCCTLVFGVEEIYMQSLSGFLSFFWWQKRITFKSSLDLYFHALIIDLPSYGSESRKRYTLMLLLMCIKARRSTNNLPGWKVCLGGMRGRRKVWVGSPFLYAFMLQITQFLESARRRSHMKI